MLNALIKFSLKRRLLVALATIVICVYGSWLLSQLPVDVFPNLNRPTVTVLTEAHGLAPEEVETLVTLPIETVLNGTPGALRSRSSSGLGISIVYVEFDWGTDIFKNRQLIAERLQLLSGRLPPKMQPVMGPVSSIMGEIQFVGLTSPEGKVSAMDLRTLADWTIRPRLMTIPGVSQIIVMGGDVKQYQILVSSEKLQRKSISLEVLKTALGELSENTTGGFVDVGEREFLIRPIGRASSIEEIENSLVTMHFGKPVFVKDIAEVKVAPKLKRGDAGVNGKPSVVITIQKQPEANTVSLTKAIAAELVEIEKSLPVGARLETDLFKQSHFIETAIRNVELALRDGIIMVAVILFLFLMNVRTTAITLVAIPVSLLLSIIVFHLFQISINTMTLGGLAIAIGELVDDAIVDVENVYRRLRENRAAGSPRGYLRVIYEASSEVRQSIVLSTIIVILVFIPLFALGGIEGRLFVPLGIAYIISILASLVVSLTITPALCAYLLPNSKAIEEKEDGPLVRRLKSFATWVLHHTLPHPLKVLSGAALLFTLSLLLVPMMGRKFLPEFNEGTATIGIAAAPGISLEASNALGIRIEKAVLEVPEVKSTVRRTGRAELDEHAEGVHWNEVDIDFKPEGRDRPVVLNDIRERIEKLGEVSINIGQPISHRLDHLLSGVRAQIAIKVFGPDLVELRRLGGEVYDAISGIPGVVDLQTEPLVLIPQLKIGIDREAAGEYGIRTGALAGDLELALNGENVARLLEYEKQFDVVMRLDDSSRATPEKINNTLVKFLPTGQGIKLGDVANVYQGTGPNMVNREDMQRRIIVSANTFGRDLGSIVGDIERAIDSKVRLDSGYFIKIGGQFATQQAADKRVFWLGLISIIGIFCVLMLHFRSNLICLQIMMNVPLALIGSIIAIFITERNLSVASLVAFITLCGISSRNGILLISHYLHLIEKEGETFGTKMVIRGSLERLVPVLMTASTAALALVPLLFAHGEPGKEILYPVAVVIAGGLVSSTILDLVVTPTVFLRFGQNAVQKYLNHAQAKANGEWK